MDELVALRCPSCGGSINVGKNLTQMYCNFCGTQLLLKQGSDGLLTPILARDLSASAQLKEAQTTATVVELLRTQIKELEERVGSIRRSFLQFYCSVGRNTLGVVKAIRDYQKNLGLPKDNLFRIYTDCVGWGKFDIDKMAANSIPGFDTSEDIFNLHAFLTRPTYGNKHTRQVAAILQPILQVHLNIQKKRQDLEEAIREVTRP